MTMVNSDEHGAGTQRRAAPRAVDEMREWLRGELETPVGRLFFIERSGAVCALGFVDERTHASALLAGLLRRFGKLAWVDAPANSATLVLLRAYLAGELDALDRIAVDLGGTPFQQRVWRALRAIPAGATSSYGEIARAIDAPAAVRAVGAANGANPVSLIVPCHRVIRGDGSLCGYAGGIARKRWLLDHERANQARRQSGLPRQ